MRRPAATTALVAAAYLAVTLLIYQAVLPAPRTLLPYPAMLDANSFVRANFANLDHHDQSMVVATVTRNAAKLVTAPWDLFGDGQCYPMPRSYTLGEHMFGLGFLATLPYALTRDPILSFNFAADAHAVDPGDDDVPLLARVHAQSERRLRRRSRSSRSRRRS